MANQLYIPRTNPANFYEITPVVLPQYHTKTFNDFPFADTVKDWEIPACYCQKWQTNDTFSIQLIANFTGAQIDLVNKYGRVFKTASVVPKLQSEENPGFYAQESALNFTGVTEGVYFVKLSLAGTAYMISEPMWIKADWPNTVLFKYKNVRYHNDIIYETGFNPTFRIEGSIGRLIPGSTEQFYADQKLNQYLLSSRTFNKFNLNIGGNKGMPDWAADKINLIFSCSEVRIDGIEYAKVSDGEYEFIEESEYPLRSINMVIQEGVNRSSKIINPDLNTNFRTTVLHNIRTSALFGNMVNTDDTIVITGTE